MKLVTNYDYIIIGQGLAGSALAYHLIDLGKSVLVIDQNEQVTSSKVAAGLYNPVTGRKMVKTWMADDLFPCMVNYYKQVEQSTANSFLHEIPIYRPFISVEEQNEWMGKSGSAEYDLFIKEVHQKPLYSFSNDPYGGVELAHSGYLDIPSYLHAYKLKLQKHNAYLEEEYKDEYLSITDHVVSYKEYKASKVIFANGLGALNSRYWSWLPFHSVKGEILTLEINQSLSHILNRGVFLLPLANGTFRVGSNYNNRDKTLDVTPEARQEIEGKLNDLITCGYEVIAQKAGIRPATKDRRPFVGLHPDYETVGLFNGLGTKGVSLAPYFAKQFAEYLEKGSDLADEVNISRYFSLYYDALKDIHEK